MPPLLRPVPSLCGQLGNGSGSGVAPPRFRSEGGGPLSGDESALLDQWPSSGRGGGGGGCTSLRSSPPPFISQSTKCLPPSLFPFSLGPLDTLSFSSIEEKVCACRFDDAGEGEKKGKVGENPGLSSSLAESAGEKRGGEGNPQTPPHTHENFAPNWMEEAVLFILQTGNGRFERDGKALKGRKRGGSLNYYPA